MRDWLAGVVGNDWAPVVSVILAAAVVILLALVLIGLAKRVFSGTGGIGGRSRAPRLAGLDVASIDPKRKLVLVRRDEVEHLLLIGGQNDVVIEPGIVRGQPQARRPRIDPAVRSEPELSRDPAPERVGQAVPQRRVPVAPVPATVPAPAPAPVIPAAAEVAPPQRQPIPLVPPVVPPLPVAASPVPAPVAAEPARVIVEPVRTAETERSAPSAGETRATFGRTPPLVSAIIPPPANPIAASRGVADQDAARKDPAPIAREREPAIDGDDAPVQPATPSPSMASAPAPAVIQPPQPAAERTAAPRPAPSERPTAPPRPTVTRPPEAEQTRTGPMVTPASPSIDEPPRSSEPVPTPVHAAPLHFNPAPTQPVAQPNAAATAPLSSFAPPRSMATPTLPVPPRAPPAPTPTPTAPTPARSLWSAAPTSATVRAPNGADSAATAGDDGAIRNGGRVEERRPAPPAAVEIPRTPFADGPILRADEPLIETGASEPASTPAPVVAPEARQPLSVRSFATTIQERRPPAPVAPVATAAALGATLDRPIVSEPVRDQAPSHIEPEIHAIHEPMLPQDEEHPKAAPQTEPERELTLEEEMERLLHDFTLDVSDRR